MNDQELAIETSTKLLARAEKAESQRDVALAQVKPLREDVSALLEVIDHAESKVPHSPWCNGNHEGTSCEGDYMVSRLVERVRTALAAAEPAKKES